MRSVREQVREHFLRVPHTSEPDDNLASALYALLWTIKDKTVSVDGWTYFRVVRESEDFMNAVRLMTLLPSGSAPIEIKVNRRVSGFAWSAQIGRLDSDWTTRSDSKRWKEVYRYATGGQEEPQWRWGQQYNGSVRNPGA